MTAILGFVATKLKRLRRESLEELAVRSDPDIVASLDQANKELLAGQSRSLRLSRRR